MLTLDRQAELDRIRRKTVHWTVFRSSSFREHRWATGLAFTRSFPGHVLVQPDQQRPALAKRSRVAGPVRRAVAGGCRLAHAPRLTEWFHDVNPSQTEFYNNALLPSAVCYGFFRLFRLLAQVNAARFGFGQVESLWVVATQGRATSSRKVTERPARCLPRIRKGIIVPVKRVCVALYRHMRKCW